MLSAEVSLYPIEAEDADRVINESLDALAGRGLRFDVGTVSTRIVGDDDEVWAGMRALYERALAHGGEVAMTVTLTNGLP